MSESEDSWRGACAVRSPEGLNLSCSHSRRDASGVIERGSFAQILQRKLFDDGSFIAALATHVTFLPAFEAFEDRRSRLALALALGGLFPSSFLKRLPRRSSALGPRRPHLSRRQLRGLTWRASAKALRQAVWCH